MIPNKGFDYITNIFFMSNPFFLNIPEMYLSVFIYYITYVPEKVFVFFTALMPGGFEEGVPSPG